MQAECLSGSEWRRSGLLRGSRLKRAAGAAAAVQLTARESTARVIMARTCMNEAGKARRFGSRQIRLAELRITAT